MRVAAFLLLWMLVAIGAPMATAPAFPFEYPLISLAGALGFIGGGFLAVYATGISTR